MNVKTKSKRKASSTKTTKTEQAMAAPLSMTQKEVDAMARGSKIATVVRKRLKRLKYPKVKAVAKVTKLSPTPISAREMTVLQRNKVLSAAILRRMTKFAQRDIPTSKKGKTTKATSMKYIVSSRKK